MEVNSKEPQPPADVDLKNIIDKLAQFVARNGPEFEQMTKEKQKGNPKFEFLFGGEHYQYYRFKVESEPPRNVKVNNVNHSMHPSMNMPPASVTPWINVQQTPLIDVEALTAQQAMLREQIVESETNLNAQYAVLMQQQEAYIDDAIAKAQDAALKEGFEKCDLDMSEFDTVLEPIINTCTKDSISSGKSWILKKAITPMSNNAITDYLFKRATDPSVKFDCRLHIIYLLNDALHHCTRKGYDDLKSSIHQIIVPMFCMAMVNGNEEEKSKLQKLLSLWENKIHYFSEDIISKMKNPSESLKDYKNKLLSKHSNIVKEASANTEASYSQFQAQHQAFVTHAMVQIQALEAQKKLAEQQAMNASVPLPDATNVPIILNNAQQATSTATRTNFAASGSEERGPPYQGVLDYRPQEHPAQAHRDPRPYTGQQATRPPVQRQQMASAMAPHQGGNDAHYNRPKYHNNMAPQAYHLDQRNKTRFDDATPAAYQDYNNMNMGVPGRPPFHQQPPHPQFGHHPNNFMGGMPLPDFSRPPPNFPPMSNIPPLMSLPPPDFIPEDLIPTLPYFELPAGLMVPLVKLEDYGYKPLRPEDIRLPPPLPPSERLMAAVKAFYAPPVHDRPRDSDGWEKLGLYEYYRAKNLAKQTKMDELEDGVRKKSRSPSPILRQRSKSKSPKRRKYKSRSRSRSKSKERTPTPPPHQISQTPSRSKANKRKKNRGAKQEKSMSPNLSLSPTLSQNKSMLDMAHRSPTPPSFLGSTYGKSEVEKIDPLNKGHQLLKKMGWGGAGLGAKEQGIEAPISGGEIRDRVDQYKGIGVNLKDPYENFRKNRGRAYISRMKERADEKSCK